MRFYSCLLCILLVTSVVADAQQHDEIVASVNGDIISLQEFEEFLTMSILSAGETNDADTRQNWRARALQELIVDKIKSQEGEKYQLTPPRAQIEGAMRNVEVKNGLKEGEFEEFMLDKGMPVARVLDHMRASLYWDNVVRYILARQISVSDVDVAQELERYQVGKGKTEYALYEIFIPYDDETEQSKAKALAQAQELRAQIFATHQVFFNFIEAAGQYSQLPSASVGGNVGWTYLASLPVDMRESIKRLAIGEVSDVLATARGVFLYYLHDRRRVGDEQKRLLSLRRYALDESEDILSEEEFARAQKALGAWVLRDRFCALSETEAQKTLAQEGYEFIIEDIDDINEENIVAGLQGIISQTLTGELSFPLQDDDGSFFLQLCRRGTNHVVIPDKEQVRDFIFNSRLNQLAQRHLEDLLSRATIDIKEEDNYF